MKYADGLRDSVVTIYLSWEEAERFSKAAKHHAVSVANLMCSLMMKEARAIRELNDPGQHEEIRAEAPRLGKASRRAMNSQPTDVDASKKLNQPSQGVQVSRAPTERRGRR